MRSQRPPRRPRPGQGNDRGNYRGSDRGNDRDFKDRADREFSEDIGNRLRYFMESDETELELEPMNSYKRRLVHQIAKPYNFDSDSRGEEPGRYVALIKTSESQLPKGVSKPRRLDFGSQTFPINPGEDGLRMALKADGSLEIWSEGQSHLVLDERVVTARQVRIRNGKIVQPGESDW